MCIRDRHFYLRVARGDTKAQVLSSFMKQFYAGTPFIPREIMLQDVYKRQVQTGILFSDGWVNPAMYAKNLGINAVHPAVYHLKYPQFIEEVKRRCV